jgi:predicted lipoprotein with Yx(FWY)xxD motif
MRHRSVYGLAPAALGALAVIAAGCGGGNNSGYAVGGGGATAARAVTSVSTRHTSLGRVLVDGQGRTLYLFEKDKPTASGCNGACASIWPPLTTATETVAGGGLPTAKLGSVKRADGQTEVTYAGHPLYTYAGDAKPGDTRGQGLDQFGAEWYVLAPSGHKIDNH